MTTDDLSAMFLIQTMRAVGYSPPLHLILRKTMEAAGISDDVREEYRLFKIQMLGVH